MSTGPLVFSVVAGLVVLCAVLAAMGFRGRSSTIGVDLGTTFSVVGVVVNNKVEIVHDSEGNKIFPSVVSFLENGKKSCLYDALPFLHSYPRNTIYNAKRFIGHSLNDSNVQIYAAAHPFSVVEDLSVSNYSSVGFALTASGHPSVVSPEQVGTEVLLALQKLTAKFLGHTQVSKAVIAVPAKFTNEQRQATGHIYKSAGLKVVRVIEEPTAAAIAYKLHKNSTIHHILVYDFGGGTLDVSLLYVADGSVEVYSTDGDDMLGGSDLDQCLYHMIDRRLSMFELDDTVDDTNVDTLGLKECTKETMLQLAESSKKHLSSSLNTEVSCIDQTYLKKLTVPLSREEFESECSSVFDRAMLPVKRLLKDVEMSPEDVDEVVLVGGSTRIPLMKRMLKDFFGGRELNDHIDPDITVAFGAASVLD